MNWTERNIARALATQFFNKKYLIVVPNCSATGYECDLLCVTENLRIIDIEIKISRADLKADAKKDKWWQRKHIGYSEEIEVVRNGHVVGSRRDAVYDSTNLQWPRKVWKHYYALPKDIWHDDLFDILPSKNSGVLLLSKSNSNSKEIEVWCHRGAKTNKDAETLSPAAAVNIARLASLRMWNAHREADNCKKEMIKMIAEREVWI